MTIKKSFVPVVDLLTTFLEENKAKKVSTIREELLLKIGELTRQKVNSSTFLVDEDKNVVAIFCYYHKVWEFLGDAPYGKKASSASGFNTMCKVGSSKWTKQNNAIKKVGGLVLDMVERGEIEASEISETKVRLIEELRNIDIDGAPIGYLTLEEAQEHLDTID